MLCRGRENNSHPCQAIGSRLIYCRCSRRDFTAVQRDLSAGHEIATGIYCLDNDRGICRGNDDRLEIGVMHDGAGVGDEYPNGVQARRCEGQREGSRSRDIAGGIRRSGDISAVCQGAACLYI